MYTKNQELPKRYSSCLVDPLQHCKDLFCVMATGYSEELGVEVTMRKNVLKTEEKGGGLCVFRGMQTTH